MDISDPLDAPPEMLRVATAGSVDDGKSTLIGRLLHDTRSILDDQLDAVHVTSQERGDGRLDLALLTDGLRAEREQGITIDVAYRFFTTPRRSFILADTPGHVRYTRNMVTGASTADVAIVLIDARHGVVEQSKRHAFIASLLGVPHIVACVNKMDLIDWDRGEFEAIAADFAAFGRRVGLPDVAAVPVSALNGDNVVERSDAAPWYDGPPLLEYLEEVDVAADRRVFGAARLPVQWVVRPHDDAHHDYRGHAGQVAGGVLRAGDEVVVLPQRARTRVARIDSFDGPVEEAFPPMSVTVLLEDDLDVSRGDMLCAADAPASGRARPARRRLLARRCARPSGRAIPDQAHDTDDAGRADADRAPRRGREPAHRSRPGRPRAQRHRTRSRYAPRGRWRSTRTPTAAPPAASFSSTRRPTRPWRRAWCASRSPTPTRAARTWCGSAARPHATTAGRRSASPAPPSG